jgi:hypothetical protein
MTTPGAKKLTVEDMREHVGQDGSPPAKRNGLDAIHQTVAKWLALPEGPQRFDGIDMVHAVVIANRISTDPCWLLLVAPRIVGEN